MIERVSTLFRGHPSLIQGFNTFLPPGYRIECSSDPSESNLITVTTPTGTTTQTPGGVGIAGAISRAAAPGAGQGMGSRGAGGPVGARETADGELMRDGAPSTLFASSSDHDVYDRRRFAAHPHGPGHAHPPSLPSGSLAGMHGHRPHSPSGMAPPTPGAAAGAGVLSLSGGADGGVGDGKRPPVEFNHAINYVNKIKQRFSNDPDTYKQFLEILQTYQKEQRPIQDVRAHINVFFSTSKQPLMTSIAPRQVYAQVTILFDNAKDLLDEFKQFLPDTSNGQPSGGGLFGMLGQMTSGMGGPPMPIPTGRMEPVHDKKSGPMPAVAAPGRKKRGNQAAEPGRGGQKTKKSKAHHKERSPMRELSPSYHAMAPPGAMMHPYGPDGALMPPEAAMMQPGMMGPPGIPGMGPGIPHGHAALATVDEVAFFERVKKHIDDRPTYIEFLKLLNLFTQDIIDMRTLVDRAALFIGGQRDLFATFKALCGYDMGKHGWLDNEDPIIENVPAIQRERVDLSTCKSYGASYRKLPKSEVSVACSGRDPMCWEVLNDSWVCHPTLASEGEGFNPHKKNVYEDALYRSEEERHEYDYHIEANLRTIALLEPIAARISMMDPEERQAFRLKPGLGGQSKSIYQRVIKKIYGRDHGVEVINALHDNPCNAVPVVLARLKQKDEEWKRCQREWNKVWREVDARNYYKSLDHQGVNFKSTDKKAITSKAFVAEIESRRIQQLQRRLALDASLPRPKVDHQLTYQIDDLNVLVDVVKLAFSFLDRAAYNKADCDRIEALLRGYVPRMLGLDERVFEELVNGDVVLDGDDDDAASEGVTDDESPEGSQKRRQRHQSDLRRKVLKTQAGHKGNVDGASGEESTADGAGRSYGVSGEDGNAGKDVEMSDAADAVDAAEGTAAAKATWASTDTTHAFDSTTGKTSNLGPSARATRKGVNFFCSTPHYVFMRLLQLLYARLQKMKKLGNDMAHAQSGRGHGADRSKGRANPIALELGLQDPSTGPAAVVGIAAASVAQNQNGVIGQPADESISGISLHPSRYYDTLLDLTEKFFDGELDSNTFEESVRYMYGIEGYIVFTIDKVVGALIKAAQVITSDHKSQELQSMMENDRGQDYKDHIARRMKAESIVGKDENLYRIEWLPSLPSAASDEDQSTLDGTLLVQLLSRDDLTLDAEFDSGSAQEKWLYYISSYTLWTPTEGLSREAKGPFLDRSLKVRREIGDDTGTAYRTRNGLEIKVCISTYRLFFGQDSEDYFARLLTKKTRDRQVRKLKSLDNKRVIRFNQWLQSKAEERQAPEAVEGTSETAVAEPAV